MQGFLSSFVADDHGTFLIARTSSGLDGRDVDGKVIGDEYFDAGTGRYDLESNFTVQCDDGEVFAVHGWMVDITVVGKKRPLVM